MGFDEAYELKNWEVSWLLLPAVCNWKAAELTEHFSSTFNFDRADAGDGRCSLARMSRYRNRVFKDSDHL